MQKNIALGLLGLAVTALVLKKISETQKFRTLAQKISSKS